MNKVISKVKSVFDTIGKKGKMIACSMSAGLMCLASSAMVSASDGGGADVVQTALTSGLGDTAKTIMICVAAIIPIGLGIFGAKKAIEWAKKFFNKVSQ